MERSEVCTLEAFLRHDCGLSRRQLCRLKHVDGGILCGGKPIRSIDTVHPGDEVILRIPDVPNIEANPALQVPLVFEDEDLLVFHKPAGMPVHPSLNHRTDTLGNAFAAQFPALTFRPVHRLDCNTSGLCAVAKHPIAAASLPGRLEKTYLAITGGMPPDSGTIRVPIARCPDSLIRRQVSADGKPAVTHYRILQRGRYNLAEIRLETGRTHQIRVHFSHISCPLAGDDLYGGDTSDIRRHALHCAVLQYTDGKGCCHQLEAALPQDMQALL